ncbi:MAG: family 16 glycoside hydrolase [Bacteroidota bacterium]
MLFRFLFIGLLGIPSAFAQPTIVDLDPEDWILPDGSKARYEEIDGRKTVELNGKLLLKDQTLQEGIIRVDIFGAPERSFAGLVFHKQADFYEEVYLRLHKSGSNDALQYTPVFNKESNWQLLSQAQANPAFKMGEWNTLEIHFNSKAARILVNGQTALVVHELNGLYQDGQLGLWSLFPSTFSNFSFEAIAPEIPSPAEKPSKTSAHLITSWEISKAYPLDRLPEMLPNLDQLNYRTAETWSDGVLPISKYTVKAVAGKFLKNSEDFAVAKLSLDCEKATTKWLQFDFSDRGLIILNGKILFQGDNQFRLKGLQYMGNLNPLANTIPLYLKEGKNELLIVVIEKTNGWGLIGQWLPEADEYKTKIFEN